MILYKWEDNIIFNLKITDFSDYDIDEDNDIATWNNLDVYGADISIRYMYHYNDSDGDDSEWDLDDDNRESNDEDDIGNNMKMMLMWTDKKFDILEHQWHLHNFSGDFQHACGKILA